VFPALLVQTPILKFALFAVGVHAYVWSGLHELTVVHVVPSKSSH